MPPLPCTPSAVKDDDDTCKPPPLTTRHRSINPPFPTAMLDSFTQRAPQKGRRSRIPFLQTEADSFTQCVRQQERRSRIPMSSTAGGGVTLHFSYKS